MQRELVVRAQAGDVDAFSVLARQVAGPLKAVAYRILRDADAADDATQRALIAMWDHFGDLRDPDRWQGWAYRLVVNAAYREARRERSQRAGVRFLDLRSQFQADAARDVAQRDEFERAFGSLPTDQRAVIVLHHYVGLSIAEVAEILGIPVGTVGSRLNRAAHHLRAALDAEAAYALVGSSVS